MATAQDRAYVEVEVIKTYTAGGLAVVRPIALDWRGDPLALSPITVPAASVHRIAVEPLILPEPAG